MIGIFVLVDCYSLKNSVLASLDYGDALMKQVVFCYGMEMFNCVIKKSSFYITTVMVLDVRNVPFHRSPSAYNRRPTLLWITGDFSDWPRVLLLNKFTMFRCKSSAFTLVMKAEVLQCGREKVLQWEKNTLECLKFRLLNFNDHMYEVFSWCKGIVLTIC